MVLITCAAQLAQIVWDTRRIRMESVILWGGSGIQARCRVRLHQLHSTAVVSQNQIRFNRFFIKALSLWIIDSIHDALSSQLYVTAHFSAPHDLLK